MSDLDPRTVSAWVSAKRETPTRKSFTPEDLVELRIAYGPSGTATRDRIADRVVIWTLLGMLEEQRGWNL